MGSRGVLRRGHIFELEILLHGADDFRRRYYHLAHLRGLDRRKAISPRLRDELLAKRKNAEAT